MSWEWLVNDEVTIKKAIRAYAAMWHSDRAKRSTVEKALERKISRHGYDVSNGAAKIDALIAAGKLKEENGYLLVP